MKVSVCEKLCTFYERRTWTQKIYPKDYHPIGFSHAYGYCKYNDSPCADVKKSMCINGDFLK